MINYLVKNKSLIVIKILNLDYLKRLANNQLIKQFKCMNIIMKRNRN